MNTETPESLPVRLPMTRLGVMMFLEFFLWGAWMVPMGKYLSTLFAGESDVGQIIGQAYSTGSIAAIVAPLFVGLLADRFLPGQVVLGLLHLLGAGFLYAVAQADSPSSFYWLLLGAGLCYMPTLALVNSVSFDLLKNPQKQFPLVRVWGTIGWIAAGITVGSLLPPLLASGGLPTAVTDLLLGDASDNDAGKTNLPFLVAAATSLVLGLYSFTLPGSPPKAKGEPISIAKLLGFDAIGLLKQPAFAIFAVASFLICIPLAVYYAMANKYIGDMGIQQSLGLGSETVMTFGQMSEIGFMLLMPFFLARFGVKTMLLGGMLAWVARYVLFAFGAEQAWMLTLAVILHGICYDFFFVTGQLYTDHIAPRQLRASAQGLIALLTYGAGMYVGNITFPEVANAFTETPSVFPWQPFWITFAGMAAVIMIGFAIAFRDPVRLSADELG
jgi:nucleoside transporter